MKPQESKELSFVASLTRRLNGGDGSAWLNLGYWGKERTSTSYPAAAEALAKTVADAAHLREYSDPIVIDVGCGLGESLTLWANEYGADIRRSLGINVSAAEVAAARARGGLLAARVVQGDASELPVGDGTADAVLAIDAAYHFRSRAAFLREAGRVLRCGGTFGAADIIAASVPETAAPLTDSKGGLFQGIESSQQHSWLRWLICSIVGIPLINIYSEETYRQLLATAGLGCNVAFREATVDVTDGFTNWAKCSGSWVLWTVGIFLKAAMRGASLRFVVVSATKK